MYLSVFIWHLCTRYYNVSMLNAFRFSSCGNRNGNSSLSFGSTSFSFNSVSVLTDWCKVSIGLGVKFLWRDWVRAILGHSFITASPTTVSLFDPCSVNVAVLSALGEIFKEFSKERSWYLKSFGHYMKIILSHLSYLKMLPALLHKQNVLNIEIQE